MSLKEYSAADGAHIDSSPSFDPAGAEQRLAEDREWYAHQAMQGRAPDVIVQIPLAAAAHYGVQVGMGTVVAGQDDDGDQDDDEGEPA